MTYEVISDLCESRLYPTQQSLRKEDFESLSETAYLLVLALRICLKEEGCQEWARLYTKRTMRASNFKSWRSDATDIYAVFHALTTADYAEDDDSWPMVAEAPFVRWLRQMISGGHDNETRRLFARLDQMLRIRNQSMRSIRRLVMDWDDLSKHEKKLATTRLLQFIRARHPRAEILPFLVKVAKENGLEIKGANNPEAPERERHYVHVGDAPKEKGSSFLASLAAIGAGAYAGYKLTVKETTSASSIAAVPTALGAHPGFDPNGHKGIYEPSVPMIRRGEAPKKKK